jgi:hypothetical protein
MSILQSKPPSFGVFSFRCLSYLIRLACYQSKILYPHWFKQTPIDYFIPGKSNGGNILWLEWHLLWWSCPDV